MPVLGNEIWQLDPNAIVIGERQRKNTSTPSYELKLDELTASIREHGLLHPIVVDRSLTLITGFTRLTAIKRLGWPTIPARFYDQLDEVARKEIELEENLARADLTVLEVVHARTELHRLKQERYGPAQPSNQSTSTVAHANPADSGWSVRHTAESLGITPRQLFSDLAVAKAIELVPALGLDDQGREETSKAIILKKIDRLIEDIELQIKLIDTHNGKLEALKSSVILGDALVELAKIPTSSVDLIITDPPYGVDYDSIGGSAYRTQVEFDDSSEAVLALLRSVTREMRRVLRDDGLLYSFFGIQLWSQTLAVFRGAGFDVDPLPLVWVKNTGGTVDWDHRFAPAWEPILYAKSSSRRLARKRDNVFAYAAPGTAERFHANEKPVALLRELIELSTQPGELVLDPFAGSGSTLQAAKDSGRRFLGIEQNPRFIDYIRMRLSR